MNCQDLQGTMIAAVDDVMGEDLSLFPMQDGRTDTSRERVTVSGLLRAGAGANTNVAGTQSSGWGARIAAGKAQAHISLAAHPGLVVRRGDRLVAMERAGQPFFEVSDVDDRTYGRLVVGLTEL